MKVFLPESNVLLIARGRVKPPERVRSRHMAHIQKSPSPGVLHILKRVRRSGLELQKPSHGLQLFYTRTRTIIICSRGKFRKKIPEMFVICTTNNVKTFWKSIAKLNFLKTSWNLYFTNFIFMCTYIWFLNDQTMALQNIWKILFSKHTHKKITLLISTVREWICERGKRVDKILVIYTTDHENA